MKKLLCAILLVLVGTQINSQNLKEIFNEVNEATLFEKVSDRLPDHNSCLNYDSLQKSNESIWSEIELIALDHSNNYIIGRIDSNDTTYNLGFIRLEDKEIIYFSFSPFNYPRDLQTNLVTKPVANVKQLYSFAFLDCQLNIKMIVYVNQGMIRYLSLPSKSEKKHVVYLPKYIFPITELTSLDELVEFSNGENYDIFSIVVPMINPDYFNYLWLVENKYLNELFLPDR